MEKGFIVTRSGRKISVDLGEIPDDEFFPFHQSVGLYTDNTELKPVWIVELQKSKNPLCSRKAGLEFVNEIIFEHKPTKEEILYEMSASGLSRFDVVTITKGYQLDITDDE